MATATRRRKKNAARGHVATPDLIIQPDEWLPGVPAFQEGGPITVPTSSDTAIQGPNLPPPPAFGDILAGRNFLPIPGRPGVFFDTESGRVIDTNAPTGGGASGPAWRPGEQHLQQLQLQLAQDRLELDRAIANQQDTLAREIQDRIDQRELVANMIRAREAGLQAEVAQRGQDISAAIRIFETLAADARARMQDARAAGDQALAAAAMEDARVIADMSNRLQQAQLDVQVRGQDIEAGTRFNELLVDAWGIANQSAVQFGNLEVARFAEERLAAEQRQQVALDQYDAALAGQGLRISAQQGAATTMGQLAQSFGDVQARRQEGLLTAAANPRDWVQAQIMMGGGQNPFDALTRGVTPEGQNIGRSQGSPLGADFGRLITAATERPDIAFFEEARDMARRLQGMGQGVPGAPSLQMLQGLGQFPQMGAMPQMTPQPNFQMPQLPGFGPVPGLEDFFNNFGSVPTPPPAPPLNPLAPPQLPPQFQFKKGGELTITEPTVGIGTWSGRPLFTLVEDGKPEKLRPTATGMEVVPFQAGGNVNWWDASRLTKKPRATGTPARRQTSPIRQAAAPLALAAGPTGPTGATRRPPALFRPAESPVPGTVAPTPSPPVAPGTPAYEAWKQAGGPAPGTPEYDAWKAGLVPPAPVPGTVAPPGVPPFAPGTPEYEAWKEQIAAGADPTWGINMPPDMGTGDPWERAPEPPQFAPGWRPPGNAVWRNPGGTAGWGFWNPIQGSSAAGARVSVPGQDWNRSASGVEVSAQFDQNGQRVRLVRNPLTGETRTQVIGQNMSEVFPEIVSPAAARRGATAQRDLAAEHEQNLAAFQTMLQGMTQQVWEGMSWSAQQMFLSAGSSVGFAPEDTVRSMQNAWPTGADPSQVMFGTNF